MGRDVTVEAFGGHYEEASTRSTLTPATDVGPAPTLSRNHCSVQAWGKPTLSGCSIMSQFKRVPDKC